MNAAVALPSQLNAANALQASNALQTACAQQAQGGGVWSLDASALQQFDTAALAVLLALRRSAQAASSRLTVRHMPPKLSAIAQLYGLGDLLEDSPPKG